ncbi:NAD(P)-dependent oxidoreductase [Primorskyibacter sp. S187A]|uniref:NAD(P)-dependent oxidoreductase n=1 Tax=Primorskyibacter sp. S187A TaxID=3415130 RepID=UPI003C7B4E3D
MKIALLGTGLMGSRMGANLLKHGHNLSVWNRTVSKTDGLVEEGARAYDTPAGAIDGAEVVVTMLSDGPTMLAMIENVSTALSNGQLWLDMSSTKPDEARKAAEILAARQIAFLDAPVSGGTKGAEAGTLAIMAGGEAETFARAKPVFEAMGRPVHVGPHGAGQLSKLCNQTIVAVTIGAVAEAMLLAERGGADPAALRDALKGGFADSTILQQHGHRMTTGNFDPGGLSKFQLKDLDNVLAEAEAAGLTLPMTQGVRDRFDTFVHDMDGADRDHSGLYLELKARNGLS